MAKKELEKIDDKIPELGGEDIFEEESEEISEFTVDDVKEFTQHIKKAVHKIIIGQEKIIDLLLISLLSNGHMLLEGLPGLAKTLMVKTLSSIIGCSFKRVQFTPDLLPTDIIGTYVYDARSARWTLKKGPIFTNILLADEINRASPKTQSAMLECMEEKQVTIEGAKYMLDRPFLVLATQNPIEQEGTYPLPEAQLDRFLIKANLTYPSTLQEFEILKMKQIQEKIVVEEIVSKEVIIAMQEIVKTVYIDDVVLKYITEIVKRTRNDPHIELGAGPRASIALMITSKARAAMNGRDYVNPDDVKSMVDPILNHRILVKPEYEIEGLSVFKIISDILAEVEVPKEAGKLKIAPQAIISG